MEDKWETLKLKTNTTLVKGQTEYTFLNLEILEAIQIEKISLEDMVIKGGGSRGDWTKQIAEELSYGKRFKRSYFKTRWMDNGTDWFW